MQRVQHRQKTWGTSVVRSSSPSESHPLYATFIANLFNAIFVWDETDYNRLLLAKKGELTSTGVSTPSDSVAVMVNLTELEGCSGYTIENTKGECSPAALYLATRPSERHLMWK